MPFGWLLRRHRAGTLGRVLMEQHQFTRQWDRFGADGSVTAAQVATTTPIPLAPSR
jgi:hypothetical protein